MRSRISIEVSSSSQYDWPAAIGRSVLCHWSNSLFCAKALQAQKASGSKVYCFNTDKCSGKFTVKSSSGISVWGASFRAQLDSMRAMLPQNSGDRSPGSPRTRQDTKCFNSRHLWGIWPIDRTLVITPNLFLLFWHELTLVNISVTHISALLGAACPTMSIRFVS